MTIKPRFGDTGIGLAYSSSPNPVSGEINETRSALYGIVPLVWTSIMRRGKHCRRKDVGGIQEHAAVTHVDESIQHVRVVGSRR
jgi:hypothetical protein